MKEKNLLFTESDALLKHYLKERTMSLTEKT